METHPSKMGDLMKKNIVALTAAMLLAAPAAATAQTRWFFDLETGVVTLGYNDVQVPKEGGTLFSLKDDLDPDLAPALRIRAGLSRGRHTFSLFAAPLTVKASGTLDGPLSFFEETFPAGNRIRASYTFNSWRATYRYTIHQGERWRIGLGFTAKIRDAVIEVDGGGLSSRKTNVGFVPLLNLRIDWNFRERWSLLLEADALAAPGGQGRAEDVLLALTHRLSAHVELRAGYRVVEGGANVDEVYNFAWINFFTIGTRLIF